MDAKLHAAGFGVLSFVVAAALTFSASAQFGATKPLVGAGCFPGGNDSAASLLLHANGSNGSTTFLDASQFAQTTTAVGNAQQSTAQFKFGSASALFDGSGDYLQGNGSSRYAFGTGNFTIDFWMRPSSFAVNVSLVDFRDGAGDYPTLIGNNTLARIDYMANLTIRINGSSTVSLNTWSHVALSRDGTNTRLFLNGIQQGSTWATDTTDYQVAASRPVIGANGFNIPASVYFNGYIDEFRISKGVARWTSDFTPPTMQYCP